MTIEQAIELLEDVYVEEAIKQLAKDSPKDLINIWLNISEFKRAKIQRINFEPLTDQDKQIKIVYEDE